MKTVFTQRTHRHERGWKTSGLHVPLLSSGEEHSGFFRVPEDLRFAEHTNEAHRFDLYLNAKIRNWVQFKKQNGWNIVGEVEHTKPHAGPTERAGADPEDDGAWRVDVKATFLREVPIKMPLDLFLHKQEQAQRYGESLDHSMTENVLPAPRAEIEADAPVNSMQVAEQRRAQLGIRRELVLEDGIATGATVVYQTLPEGNQTVTGETNV